MSDMKAARDKAAEDFAIADSRPACFVGPTMKDFKAGWEACLAEVKRRLGEFDHKEVAELFSARSHRGVHQCEGAEWMHAAMLKKLE